MAKEPHFLLDLRLTDLTDWWLELRCCGITYLPLKMLAVERPQTFRLRDTLRLLRCRRCRKTPTKLALVDDPADRAPGQAGAPGGWRIELILPERRRAG